MNQNADFNEYVQQTLEKIKATDTTKGYRVRAKSLFLTYPVKEGFFNVRNHSRNPADLQHYDVLEWLWNKLAPVEYGIACMEDYANKPGYYHIHVVLVFDRKRDIQGARTLDFPSGNNPNGPIHGNYLATRMVDKAITYCKKGGNFREKGVLLAAFTSDKTKNPSKLPKRKISDVVAKLLSGGAKPVDIQREYPGYFLQHQTKIIAYKEFTVLNTKPEMLKYNLKEVDPSSFNLTPPEEIIHDWLVLNLFENRALRQKQLWIKGPPGSGKTTLSMNLQKWARAYVPIYETEFLQNYTDDDYDLIIFDEYKSQKTLTFLNGFIDGSHKTYNSKFGSTNKKKNLPALFLSNYTPVEAYSKTKSVSLDAFIDRLTIVEAVDLYALNDWLVACEDRLKTVTESPTIIEIP